MAATYVPPLLRPLTAVGRSARAVASIPEQVGHQATFVFLALVAVPRVLRHYRRQTMIVLTDVAWGRGAVIVGGGTAAVLAFLGAATGASVGIQSVSALQMVGMGSLTGSISAYATTRELAPMVAAIGFAAQAGCRMTAEIGAMRISEEIDALEAMGVRPLPFVVTTRVIAGVVTIIPLYLITLILSYASAAAVVTFVHGLSAGTYAHYFETFLVPIDVLYSLIKATIFVVAVILIHGYQGYYAHGGPEGVGRASGRAIRASLVIIVVLDTLLTLAMWGFDSGIRISG